MNELLENEEIKVMTNEAGRVVGYEPIVPERRRSRGKVLFIGGVLGLVGVGFLAAAPELGAASVVGGILASIGSAGVTLLARK
jgi:hypothetical protein